MPSRASHEVVGTGSVLAQLTTGGDGGGDGTLIFLQEFLRFGDTGGDGLMRLAGFIK